METATGSGHRPQVRLINTLDQGATTKLPSSRLLCPQPQVPRALGSQFGVGGGYSVFSSTLQTAVVKVLLLSTTISK